MLRQARAVVLVVGLCSFALAIATPIAFSAGYGIQRIVTQGQFRELDSNGLINHAKPGDMKAGQTTPDNLADLAEFVMKGEEDWKKLGWIIAVLWVANGVVMFWVNSAIRPSFAERRAEATTNRHENDRKQEPARGFEVIALDESKAMPPHDQPEHNS